MKTQFSKILVANRGEIACRILRTARAKGYRTVAVYSDADRDARHVHMADEAVWIGAAPASESYLNGAKLIAAAKQTGADAVHPGYGFLSENADFAAACVAADLVFIGPNADAIRAMGNKAAAKRLMLAAGVACVPGYQGADQSDATFAHETRRIGLPVMVKAAAGGGGRGMRLVTRLEDLATALAAARSEARAAFGSDELIVEKAISGARHIEIQVFGDQHGTIIHLGERDCSIQRRHQKVIEEAPSPAIDVEMRSKMGAAAVAAARAIRYTNAGTVEFLLDGNGRDFYFLEMNTRIQVEHPVTEAITGLDLVAWQLDVAAGGRLPLRQDQVTFHGHAIEARLYAEDPHAGFLPQSGHVCAWTMPQADGVRGDHGLAAAPTAVSQFYDPMIAKIIAHGATRDDARRKLMAALDATHVHGVTTNRAFLMAALAHPEFASGAATTEFVARNFATASAALARPAPDSHVLALAAALLYARDGRAEAWSSTGARSQPLRFTANGTSHTAIVCAQAGSVFDIAIADVRHTVTLLGEQLGDITYAIDGHRRRAHAAWDATRLYLDCGVVSLVAEDTTLAPPTARDTLGAGVLRAPMNGRIIAVHAKPGDTALKGQRLIVLEAMKMQHEITAEHDGTIETLPVKVGDQVATRQVLASLTVLTKG